MSYFDFSSKTVPIRILEAQNNPNHRSTLNNLITIPKIGIILISFRTLTGSQRHWYNPLGLETAYIKAFLDTIETFPISAHCKSTNIEKSFDYSIVCRVTKLASSLPSRYCVEDPVDTDSYRYLFFCIFILVYGARSLRAVSDTPQSNRIATQN